LAVFERLGAAVYRRRRLVFIAALIGIVFLAVFGFRVLPKLDSGGFNDPGSDSAAVTQILQTEFDSPDADLVVALKGAVPADDPSFAAMGKSLTTKLAAIGGVKRVTSYWLTPSPSLTSSDGNGAVLLVTYEPSSTVAASDITDEVKQVVAAVDLGATQVYLGGSSVVSQAITGQISSDLARSEAIAIPLTTILLLIVFGSLVAAGMPLLVGLASIFGSFFILYLLTYQTDVSVFALNLVTGLGLGLGIDYSLLVVSRFREELASGREVGAAVARTVASAGRTVVFSGLTVALTLAAMLFFPQFFLRSFAYGGISVVAFAVIGAVIVLPAVLGLVGPRINSLRIRRSVDRPNRGARWATLATAIMRRPWPVAIGSIAVLMLLAWPALGAKFGQIDERALPRDNYSVLDSAAITEDFPGLGGAPIDVMVPADVDAEAIADYAADLSLVATIEGVDSPAGLFEGGARVGDPTGRTALTSDGYVRLIATSTERPRSPAAEVVIAALRAVPAPSAQVLVGGFAAQYTDSQRGILQVLPWALGWVLVTVLLLLFMFTGSILLPIKAIILNILSLSAAIGVMVWIFQDGHLAWLVGDFVNTGTIDTSTVVLTAIVAFGLSMDYEVFLLSRIKEEYDRSGDNTASVALGLQRSAGIITAAAVLLAVNFAAFIPASVTNIKILGVGVTVAILLDATIVRLLLVPAFMRIAGRTNWWAPAPLRRVYERFGLAEH
jgi:RND superfamily putative drug exporter